MAIFTLAEVEEQLSLWKDALRAVSTGQKYQMGNKYLTRADLMEIRNTLDWLEEQKANIENGTKGPIFVAGRVRR